MAVLRLNTDTVPSTFFFNCTDIDTEVHFKYLYSVCFLCTDEITDMIGVLTIDYRFPIPTTII